ncbi:Crp/Fnr family transcriptional regulator [Sphaerisporangium perillae]|uniref:Crp/Fnr family transcriptional regulator n=1 Tax=Sphaerisporangium perillae TaxID=2935860 RepID=UPI0035567320
MNRVRRRPGQSSFWNDLSPLQKRLLLKRGEVRTVQRRDVVLSDDTQNLIVLLSDCWVRLQVEAGPDDRVVIDLSGPGDLVSALHSIAPVQPMWVGRAGVTKAIALRGGRVLKIPTDDISRILERLPTLHKPIMSCVAMQLHMVMYMHAMNRLDVAPRLARLLLTLLYRFGEVESAKGHGILLAPPVSQPDLAAWIGASLASVNRVLRAWRSAGIVDTKYASISILDLKRLNEEAVTSSTPFWAAPWGVGAGLRKEKAVRQRSLSVEDALVEFAKAIAVSPF